MGARKLRKPHRQECLCHFSEPRFVAGDSACLRRSFSRGRCTRSEGWRLGNDHPGKQIGQSAANKPARHYRQSHPDQAHNRGIDIQIFGQSAAHAAQLLIRGRKRQMFVGSPGPLLAAAKGAKTERVVDFSAALIAKHAFTSKRRLFKSRFPFRNNGLGSSKPSYKLYIRTWTWQWNVSPVMKNAVKLGFPSYPV